MTETDSFLSLAEGDDAAGGDDYPHQAKRQAVEFANRMAFELTGHNVANNDSANKLSHFALNPPPKVKEYTLTGLSHDDVRKIGNEFYAAEAERAAASEGIPLLRTANKLSELATNLPPALWENYTIYATESTGVQDVYYICNELSSDGGTFSTQVSELELSFGDTLGIETATDTPCGFSSFSTSVPAS